MRRQRRHGAVQGTGVDPATLGDLVQVRVEPERLKKAAGFVSAAGKDLNHNGAPTIKTR